MRSSSKDSQDRTMGDGRETGNFGQSYYRRDSHDILHGAQFSRLCGWDHLDYHRTTFGITYVVLGI